MYKPFSLALSSLLLTAQALLAQQQQPTLHDPMAHRNHLGFNTQTVLRQFFDQDRRTPLEVMYKRQTSPDQALRLGLHAFYHRDRHNNGLDGNILAFQQTINSELQLGAQVGYEWQRSLSRRWVLFYGADSFFSFDRWLMEEDNPAMRTFIEPMTGREVVLHNRLVRATYGVGVAPLVGARFQVTPRLYAAVEVKMNVRYSKTDGLGYGKYSFTDGSREGTFNLDDYRLLNYDPTYAWDLNFRPFTGFSVFYLF